MKFTLWILLLCLPAFADEKTPSEKLALPSAARAISKDGVEYSLWEESKGCQPSGATCVFLLAYKKDESRDLWKTLLYKVVINKNVMPEIQRNHPSYLAFRGENEIEVIDDNGKHFVVSKKDGRLAPQSAAVPDKLGAHEGCGDQECCHFGIEWDVTGNGEVLKDPGTGKKIAKVKKGDKVTPSDAVTISTRGLLKITTDIAGTKAGQEVYYFDTDNGQAFTLYAKSGEKIESGSGYDFLGPDSLKPKCNAPENVETKCAAEVKKASKGNTYMKVKLKGGKEGWVNFKFLEPGC